MEKVITELNTDTYVDKSRVTFYDLAKEFIDTAYKMNKLKHTPGSWEVYIYNPQNLDISKHYIAVIKQKEIFDSSIDVICMFTEINE